MQSKLKPCDGDACRGVFRVIWKNADGKKYCKSCWNILKGVPCFKPTKKQKRISSASPKRNLQNKEYSLQRKVFLEANPMCQVHLIGCYNSSSQVHHKMGRIGELLLDQRYWLAVCDFCHKVVEDDSIWAKENGYSLNRI